MSDDRLEMRLPTAAWFAVGCGLAIMVGALGHVALESVRSDARSEGGGFVTLHALTPAPDDRTSTVVAPHPAEAGTPWANIPLQRPRQLREAPPVAPVPLAPPQWRLGDARLPSPEATASWNPNDARLPDGAASASVAAVRVYWNPDSATLPRPVANHRPVALWDPDDARLPSS